MTRIISERARKTVLAVLVLLLAAVTIWSSLQNIELRKQVALGGHSLRRGDYAPPFELRTLDGQLLGLKEFRGRQIIAIYFSPYCDQCEMEAAMWRCFHEVSQTTGSLVIGVSDSDPKALGAFMQKHMLGFPVLLDTAQVFARTYEVEATPTIIRIDSKGELYDKY